MRYDALRTCRLAGEFYSDSTIMPALPALQHPRDLPAFRLPASTRTLAGFRAWVISEEFPDHLRASFVNHDIFLDMRPEETETHVLVKYEVARVIMNLNGELRLGRFYGDGTLVTNERAELSTEPDGTFVRQASLRSGKVRLVPREGHPGQYIELEGSPDWVLEVVSRSSERKDNELLRKAYHRAGVTEYWLIDARERAIDFRILLRRRDRFVSAPDREGWRHSRVFGRSFRLKRGRDELGLWQYTLLAK